MAGFDLVFTVTTEDGGVSIAVFDAGVGRWNQSFVPLPALSEAGAKNVSVMNSRGGPAGDVVCAVDDSLASSLRVTLKSGGGTGNIFTPPLLVATGVSQPRALLGDALNASPTFPLWALGGSAGGDLLFRLPIYEADAVGLKTVREVGDLAAGLRPGDMDPLDPPVDWDLIGGPHGFLSRLFLATESGGLYFVDTLQGAFKDVKKTAAGDPGNVISVRCAPANNITNGPCHICVVNDAGKILHTVQSQDGSFLPWGDVSSATRSSDNFVQVAIAYFVGPGGEGIADRLHLAAVTSTGGLLFSVRAEPFSPDPFWTPFVDVKSQAGNPGFVTSVSIARMLSLT